jgi:hypothetical protein
MAIFKAFVNHIKMDYFGGDFYTVLRWCVDCKRLFSKKIQSAAQEEKKRENPTPEPTRFYAVLYTP